MLFRSIFFSLCIVLGILIWTASAHAQYKVEITPAPRLATAEQTAAVAPCLVTQWPTVDPTELRHVQCRWDTEIHPDTGEETRKILCYSVYAEDFTAEEFVALEPTGVFPFAPRPDQIDEVTGEFKGIWRRYGPDYIHALSEACLADALTAVLGLSISDMVRFKLSYRDDLDSDGDGTPDPGFWSQRSHIEIKTAIERAWCLRRGTCAKLME